MNVAQVRQAISAKVATIPGYKESKHTPDFFGRTQDTIAHRAYTVSMGSSTGMEERQRRDVGVYLSTSVEVIFSYRLRPLDIYPTDYDLALTDEAAIISAILEAYSSKEFTIRYVSSDRQVTDSQEYIIITLTFTTLHTI
jgi:hypothetical protein